MTLFQVVLFLFVAKTACDDEKMLCVHTHCRSEKCQNKQNNPKKKKLIQLSFNHGLKLLWKITIISGCHILSAAVCRLYKWYTQHKIILMNVPSAAAAVKPHGMFTWIECVIMCAYMHIHVLLFSIFFFIFACKWNRKNRRYPPNRMEWNGIRAMSKVYNKYTYVYIEIYL